VLRASSPAGANLFHTGRGNVKAGTRLAGMKVARTDVVGSLLRPPELLAVRDRFERGDAAAAELKAAEDRAVDAAVELQERAGMEVVTDGEMRRLSFQSGLPDAVDGFGEVPLDAYLWGEWHGEGEVGDRATERPPELGVRSPLRRRRHIAAEDFTYLRARATAIPKVTLASPSLYANLWSPERSREAYPTLDAFLEDVAALTREEISELARLGCTYIQLDAPHYPLLIDPATRAFYEGQGWPADRWLARGIELDNFVMDGHPEVTFGFHLCRGNQASRWLVEGGYEPIARQVFQGVHAQRLLLEYDDERSGSFQPLREVPDDKVVVLGLVTTKSPRQETVEELHRRIREASGHIDLERLAISPQCGFATSVLGNSLSFDDQRRKLETLARTAAAVWG
jgi:5-methyltetrahydropteroyltriglutamate--homocysteine methyltransferase